MADSADSGQHGVVSPPAHRTHDAPHEVGSVQQSDTHLSHLTHVKVEALLSHRHTRRILQDSNVNMGHVIRG